MPDQPPPRRRFRFRREFLYGLLAIAGVIAVWLAVKLYVLKLNEDARKMEPPPARPREFGRGSLIK